MDPEKTLAAVAKALGLPDDATREQMVAALDAIAKLQEALTGGTPTDDAPADEPPPAAATRTDETAVKATDVPATEPVKAADVAASEPVKAMDEAAMGELSAVMGAMQTALGMDDATFLAALRDNAEAIAGVLSGQPTSGTPADEGSAMSRAKAAETMLTLTKARVEAHEAQIATLKTKIAEQAAALGKLSNETDEQRIDAAIRAGHFLAKDRALLLSAAKNDRPVFLAHMAAGATAPAIDTTDRATGKGSKPEETTVGEPGPAALEGPDIKAATNLMRAGWSVERLATRLAKVKGIPREALEAQLRGLKNEGQA